MTLTLPILCDVDGVIADLHAEWYRRYNAEWGDSLRAEHVTDWNVHKFVKPECGAAVYKYFDEPDLYDHVPLIPGAKSGVRLLRMLGYRVVFVTSCVSPHMMRTKVEWLRRHGFIKEGKAGMQDVVIMQDKALARGALLIDDYHENLRALGGPGLLVDAPYNQQATEWPRARGWHDIPDMAEQLLATARAEAA